MLLTFAFLSRCSGSFRRRIARDREGTSIAAGQKPAAIPG
jgi:hypothetical protein